jgi:hypothetical protein
MKLDDLKRRRATLEALRLDLPHWNLGEAGEGGFAAVPVVAIDWSEIYCFVMYQPPREEADLFAAHYAGLNYLLFSLRCRPVLLPPYAAEMKRFLQEQLGKGPMPPRRSDIKQLTEKYSDLLNEIKHLREDYPAFEHVIEGEWNAIQQLPVQAWKFLETLLTEYIPDVYLNVQERTLNRLQALGSVLNALDESSRKKRMALLKDLQLLPERACEPSIASWPDWRAEMETQRPLQEPQNCTDGLALAYLQALHQAAFWQGVPVFFASRSLSMLQVMENHAGEFEPFRPAEGDASRSIRSSWRPWDYFAELGYYTKGFSQAGNGQGSNRIPEIEQDLYNRISKINQRIFQVAKRDRRAEPGDADPFSGWETLRGSFDLEGLGNKQKHWERIPVSPGDKHLIDLLMVLKSVLSAQDSGIFIQRREALAKSILDEIQSILGKLPEDAASWAQPKNYQEESAAPLTEIVEKCIDIRDVFERHVGARQNGPATLMALRRGIALLGAITKARDHNERIRLANQLLTVLVDVSQDEEIDQASREWLIGAAFFFGELLSESRIYLLPWVEANPALAAGTLALVTRAMCADTFRPTRDYDQGMRLLMDLQPEAQPPLTEIETIVWHCLKGKLLLEWMERAEEHFEIYPQPGGQRGDMAVLSPMIGAVASFIGRGTNEVFELQVRAADTVLRLAGRYIPGNFPVLADGADNPKLGWYKLFHPELGEIEKWLRRAQPDSAHKCYTLGYYNMKVALINGAASGNDDGSRAQLDKAIKVLETAKRLADKAGDKRTEDMVNEHLKWVYGEWERSDA